MDVINACLSCNVIMESSKLLINTSLELLESGLHVSPLTLGLNHLLQLDLTDLVNHCIEHHLLVSLTLHSLIKEVEVYLALKAYLDFL